MMAQGFIRVLMFALVALHAATAVGQTSGADLRQGVVFVVIHTLGPPESREYALQPGWIAGQGKMQKLGVADYRSIPPILYANGNKELRVAVSGKPQKVWIGCNDYLLKKLQGAPGTAAFATSEPLTADYSYRRGNLDAMGPPAIKEAVSLANAACGKLKFSVASSVGKVLRTVDMDMDGVPEVCVVVEVKLTKPKEFEVIGKQGILRGVVWLGMKDLSRPTVLFNGCREWACTPNAYTLEGVADFDGDGMAEVAQRIEYGEAGEGLRIFKIKNGQLEIIFEPETIGGC